MTEREPWFSDPRQLEERLFDIEKLPRGKDATATLVQVKEMIFQLRLDVSRAAANSQSEPQP